MNLFHSIFLGFASFKFACSISFVFNYWLRGAGALVVRVFDSGSTSPGLNPGQKHCIVLLGKALKSHSLPPPRYINEY